MSQTLFLHRDSAVTAEGFKRSLVKAGIRKGDVVMVHTSLFSIGRAGTESKSELLDAIRVIIEDCVGPEGSVIYPTFTLSFCRKGVFDYANSPSEMGILSEHARLSKGYVRTVCPTHSVCIFGKGQERLAAADEHTAFGRGSIFDLLHASNTRGEVKFVTLGIDNPCMAITHTHYVEQCVGVPYRYIKRLSGNFVKDGSTRDTYIDYYARDLVRDVQFDGERCLKLWDDKGIIRWETLGGSWIAVVGESEIYTLMTETIRQDRTFLAKGGYVVRE